MHVDDDRRWIEGLPKVELHVHLEGSLRPPTVAALAARHGVDTAEVWPEGLPESFSFLDFPRLRPPVLARVVAAAHRR